MQLIYYCDRCNNLVDELDVEEVDEEKLGLSILTADEKEDIIKKTDDKMEIGIICDECETKEDLVSLVNDNLVH
ncbi:anti-sigma-F factor Fin [Selenihalanaerobacter shriftii]|uniref:DUF2757 family protein n=1 Tax=Selenihalanaerobacter shriftii TaxID=142842 RepID=A0A1T4N5V3_9FIRM|nr:anti-sigma-F factor Fin [Selenihalanaerobacter shriftii]SJZ74238.1 Protein of unknown function [Selenihalanaerobacter shriftii]